MMKFLSITRLSFLVVLLVFSTSLTAQTKRQTQKIKQSNNLSNAQSNRADMLSSKTDETIIDFTFQSYEYKTVTTPRGEQLVVIAEDLSAILEKSHKFKQHLIRNAIFFY